jgi:hypothetical protein
LLTSADVPEACSALASLNDRYNPFVTVARHAYRTRNARGYKA